MRDSEPIFIISLPRSGSTLLQKIMMTHSDIDSIAEPWFLLHFLSFLKKDTQLAVYNQENARTALMDFIKPIGGEAMYYKMIRRLSMDLYQSHTSNSGARYFLDKTPRYYFIIPELAQTFPKAKFIFLFRNPVSIYTSILNSWHNGNYSTFPRHEFDLKFGFKEMQSGYDLLKNQSIALTYKKLIQNPSGTLHKVAQYLNISPEGFSLRDYYSQNLKGVKGDKTGISTYSGLSINSLEKWKSSIQSYYSRKDVIAFVKEIPDEYLENANIRKERLIQEINEISITKLGLFDLLKLKNFQTLNYLRSIIQNKDSIYRTVYR